MNYVKHLSIALLVLGSASLNAAATAPAAPAPKIVGWKTPGGTALVADKDKWTHPEAKAGGKREKFEIRGNFDVPVLYDTVKKENVKLEPIHESKGLVAKAKDVFDNWLGNKASWKERTGVAVGAAVLAGIAYKTIPTFKDGVDSAAQSAADFVNDVKDGNGNARRNAAIVGAVAATGVAGALYYCEKWPFNK